MIGPPVEGEGGGRWRRWCDGRGEGKMVGRSAGEGSEGHHLLLGRFDGLVGSVSCVGPGSSTSDCGFLSRFLNQHLIKSMFPFAVDATLCIWGIGRCR